MTKQPKDDYIKKRSDAFFARINKKYPDAKVKFDKNFGENLKAYINSKREEKPTE
jgi:hypothetical protein